MHNSYLNSKITYNNESLHSESKYDVVEKNLSTLIRLLYEIWMEVAPEKDVRAFSDFTLLHNDAAAILSCILNVMHLLLQRIVLQNEARDLTVLVSHYHFTLYLKK